MINNKKKEWAIAALRQKSEEHGRLPKKTDFDVATRSRIKAFLGPWPRALEAAGLKEAKIKPKKSHKRKRKNPSKKNCLVPHQKASKTNISEPEGYITPNEKGE